MNLFIFYLFCFVDSTETNENGTPNIIDLVGAATIWGSVSIVASSHQTSLPPAIPMSACEASMRSPASSVVETPSRTTPDIGIDGVLAAGVRQLNHVNPGVTAYKTNKLKFPGHTIPEMARGPAV